MRHVSCICYTYNIDYTLILYIIVYIVHVTFLFYNVLLYYHSLNQPSLIAANDTAVFRDNLSTHHLSNGPLYSNHGGFSGK